MRKELVEFLLGEMGMTSSLAHLVDIFAIWTGLIYLCRGLNKHLCTEKQNIGLLKEAESLG